MSNDNLVEIKNDPVIKKKKKPESNAFSDIPRIGTLFDAGCAFLELAETSASLVADNVTTQLNTFGLNYVISAPVCNFPNEQITAQIDLLLRQGLALLELLYDHYGCGDLPAWAKARSAVYRTFSDLWSGKTFLEQIHKEAEERPRLRLQRSNLALPSTLMQNIGPDGKFRGRH